MVLCNCDDDVLFCYDDGCCDYGMILITGLKVFNRGRRAVKGLQTAPNITFECGMT